jgi:hypothetical protein
VKQEAQERWQMFIEYAGVAWPAFCKGARDEWRDQMRDGFKGLAYRFYVEPFVLTYRWARRVVVKTLGR